MGVITEILGAEFQNSTWIFLRCPSLVDSQPARPQGKRRSGSGLWDVRIGQPFAQWAEAQDMTQRMLNVEAESSDRFLNPACGTTLVYTQSARQINKCKNIQ